VVEFYGTLFTGNEVKAHSDFLGFLAYIIWDLYPEENYKEGL
jgi:hypothetical protein